MNEREVFLFWVKKRESEEMKNINKIKNYLGEGAQAALHTICGITLNFNVD